MIPADRNPCSSCPYAKPTPPGLWAADEYRKLPAYDGVLPQPVFLCHHSKLGRPETLCRGWVAVHADSNSVRLAVIEGQIDPALPWEPVDVDLYRSGLDAAEGGLAGIDDPTPAAQAAIDRLVRARDRSVER